MLAPLTKRQQEVLTAIVSHIRIKGYAPSIRELMGLLNIHSTNGMTQHIRSLALKGYIHTSFTEVGNMIPRSIVVLQEESN